MEPTSSRRSSRAAPRAPHLRRRKCPPDLLRPPRQRGWGLGRGATQEVNGTPSEDPLFCDVANGDFTPGAIPCVPRNHPTEPPAA
jgi:hypothetical protein